jgi:hypothetical protein
LRTIVNSRERNAGFSGSGFLQMSSTVSHGAHLRVSLIISLFLATVNLVPISGLHDGDGGLGPDDPSFDVEDASSRDTSKVLLFSRKLQQFTNDTQESDSPFDLICCCPTTSGTYQSFQYENPPPAPTCCCNTTDVCTQCSGQTSFSSVCGSGQICGILLLMAALIGTLALTICVTGVFLARRRRGRRVTLDQFMTGGTVSARTSSIGRPAVQMIQIPADQLKEIYIKQVAHDPEHARDPRECPICLDTVPVTTGIWSQFPCGHGSCTMCVNDLLRHSSRRVNERTVAVLCPLCRTLAVAPMGEDNEPQIEMQEVVDEDQQNDQHVLERDLSVSTTSNEVAVEMSNSNAADVENQSSPRDRQAHD